MRQASIYTISKSNAAMNEIKRHREPGNRRARLTAAHILKLERYRED